MSHFNFENITTYSKTSSSSFQPAGAAGGGEVDSSVAKSNKAEEGEETMKIDSEGRGELNKFLPMMMTLQPHLLLHVVRMPYLIHKQELTWGFSKDQFKG